jgi:hypothetical protein
VPIIERRLYASSAYRRRSTTGTDGSRKAAPVENKNVKKKQQQENKTRWIFRPLTNQNEVMVKTIDQDKNLRYLLLFQGIYFGVTALWGLIDIDSFMRITGPKFDIWLVKTVSWLLLVMAISFIVAARSQPFSMPTTVLATLSAACLLGVDVYYSLTNTISKIYLIDGAVEFGLICFWVRQMIKWSVVGKHKVISIFKRVSHLA